MAVKISELEYANRTHSESTMQSVVICCGGMGYHMGNAFKQRILEYHPKDVEEIAFVYLDPDDPPETVGSRCIKEHTLIEADVTEIWNKPKSYPEFNEWFAKDKMPPEIQKRVEELIVEVGQTKKGVGATRPFGRCTVIQQSSQIRDTLEQAINSAWKDRSQPLTCFVLSSLGGGTGTGIFMDVAAILRTLMKTSFSMFNQKWEIVGVLAGPGLLTKDEDEGQEITPEDASIFQANSYAALKELNHFLHGNPFSARYRFSRELIEISNKDQYDRLFNVVFLVDKTNNEGGKFDRKADLGEMVGDTLFYLHFTRVGGQFFSRLINIRSISRAFTRYYPNEDSSPNQLTRFSTFGTATAEFPIKTFLECCKHLKICEIADRLLGEVSATEYLNEKVKAFLDGTVEREGILGELGLEQRKLIQRLEGCLPPGGEIVIGEDVRRSAVDLIRVEPVKRAFSRLESHLDLISEVQMGKVAREGRLYQLIKPLLGDLPFVDQVIRTIRARLSAMKREIEQQMTGDSPKYDDTFESLKYAEKEIGEIEKSFLSRIWQWRDLKDLREERDDVTGELRSLILRYAQGLLLLSLVRKIIGEEREGEKGELNLIEERELLSWKTILETVKANSEKRIGEIQRPMGEDRTLCRFTLKAIPDFLDFFYKNRFSPVFDEEMQMEDILRRTKREGGEELFFTQWAQRHTADEVGQFLKELIDAKVDVKEVFGGIPLDGVRRLWEVDFADIRGVRNEAGVFIWSPTGKDDFDELEKQLEIRAAPALRYNEWAPGPVSLGRLFNRVGGDISAQKWWNTKLGKGGKLRFLFLRGRYAHKVTLVNFKFGIPLAALEFIEAWHHEYDAQKKHHPLHIFPGAESFLEPHF